MKTVVDSETKQILGCDVLGVEGGELKIATAYRSGEHDVSVEKTRIPTAKWFAELRWVPHRQNFQQQN